MVLWFGLTGARIRPDSQKFWQVKQQEAQADTDNLLHRGLEREDFTKVVLVV